MFLLNRDTEKTALIILIIIRMPMRIVLTTLIIILTTLLTTLITLVVIGSLGTKMDEPQGMQFLDQMVE